MSTDKLYADFNDELQDEYGFDAHWPPGVEIGQDVSVDEVDDEYQEPLELERDCGSGSRAEDGQREVREDRPMYDGENQMVGTEIGCADAVGAAVAAVKQAAAAVKGAPPHVAAQHVAAAHKAVARAEHAVATGPYASAGAFEIGAASAADRPGSELGAGLYPEDGASEIGAGLFSEDGASEIGDMPGEGGYIAKYGQSEIGAGHYPTEGASEVGAGLYPEDGASEIGQDLQSPFETFMMDTHRIGDDEMGAGFEGWQPVVDMMGAGHYPTEGASEIGAVKVAVAKVVEKARDNRQPAPPMKVVDVDASIEEDEHSFLSDIVLGAAAATGVDQFPLLTKLLVRAGSGMEPRVVRVDTEESYKAFRTAQSPELSELSQKLEAHVADPAAHTSISAEDIDDDIADLVHIGEEAKAAEAQKRVDLWMPKRFDGKLEAWRQDDMICASMALPGRDGCVRICTSFEPVSKCVDEMARHASETNVPAEAIVGVLPAMGCVLGAGTVLKEMAAAAPVIIARPEAQVKLPFVVRVEPKTAPNLAALTMLAAAAKMGNTQAQTEWQKLASLSAPQVKAAMLEAVAVAKAATEV